MKKQHDNLIDGTLAALHNIEQVLWRILPLVLLAGCCLSAISPAFAADPEWQVNTIFGPVNSEMALNSYLGMVLTFIYSIIGIVTVIRLVLAGYKYITANGNPELAKSAKNTITHAITGLVLVLIAYLLTNIFIDENFNLKIGK